MSGYYMNNDTGAAYNEASNVVGRMSVEELTKIVNSDEELTRMVRNLSEVQQLEATKKSLEESIKRVAMRNLDKQTTFVQEKEKLAKLHHELGQRRDKLKALQGNRDDEDGESNPDVVLALMQSAAADLEQATEDMAETFFIGSKTEDEMNAFERSFIEDRKRAHELKIKAEKFHELLQMSKSTSYLNSNHHHYRS